jgi:hypothetical protein
MSGAARPLRARLAVALAVAALAGGCSMSGSDTGSFSPGGVADAGSHYGGSSGTGTSTGSGQGGSVSVMVPTGAAGGDVGAPGGPIVGSGSAGAAGPGTAGTNGTAGSTGAGGAAGTGPMDGGAVDGTGACLVTITPIAPASFSDLEAGATSILRMQASVSNYPGSADGGAPRWIWSVKMAGGGSLATLNFTPVDDAMSTIDVPLGTPGTYQVQARIEGAPACDRAPLVFVVKPPQTPDYRFRVTPPSSSQLPVREILVRATFVGEGPQALDIGDDKASEVVSLSPADVRGFALPSYIRITSPSFAFDIEGYTGRGALVAPLALALTYDVLIVPDDATLAPLLVSGLPDSVAAKMAIVPGAAVTGVMHDGDGHTIAGGRVVLRGGARPSTIGVSGADGSFALSTRDGALAADLYPPDGSGLPEAHVAASPGVVLLAGMTALDLSMDWAKTPAASLTVKVTGAGQGGTGVAGARVHAELAGPLPNVGTLHVHGPTAADLTATGAAHAEGVTDANGVVALGLLPTGTYHLIVTPPDGAAGVAITLADVSTAGGGGTIPVALNAPVTLSGTLVAAIGASGAGHAGGVAGAKVTAIDHGVLAAVTVPSTTAGPDGKYALALAAGRTYELLVEPDPALGLARSVVAIVKPASGDAPRTDGVPQALVWKGMITSGGRAVGGALVQAFCGAPAASCLDPTLAVAQAVTAADGTATLALPASVSPQ